MWCSNIGTSAICSLSIYIDDDVAIEHPLMKYAYSAFKSWEKALL